MGASPFVVGGLVVVLVTGGLVVVLVTGGLVVVRSQVLQGWPGLVVDEWHVPDWQWDDVESFDLQALSPEGHCTEPA